MEDKINIKETLEKLKKEQVERFINGKASHEGFTDEQKGIISAWLEEAINLGYEIGEEHGMGEANPEALGRIIDAFSSAMGIGGSNEGDEHLKKIIYSHRGIIRFLVMAISSYESLTDELVNKSLPLKSRVFECFGAG